MADDVARAPISAVRSIWWLRAALALCGGAMAGLGHVPFSLVPLSIVGFAIIAWLCVTSETARSAGLSGWLAGSAYFGVTLFWIVEPFYVDAARHGWMAPFAVFFLATGLALFWALGFWLATRLTAPRGPARALGFVAGLGLTELARAYVLTGFPWAIPAYIWVDTSARAWASVIGPHGLTLATLGIGALLALAVLQGSRGLLPAVAAMGLLGLAIIGGRALLPPESLTDTAPIVRLVQPNAPQDEKWHPDKAVEFVRRQIRFTAAETELAPDLVIWPETAIPWLLDRAGAVLAEISVAARDRPVILGVQRLEEGRYFNGLAVLGAGGSVRQTYDKHHLVPFGEYMPFPELARWTGIRGIAERADGSYTPGPGPALLDLGALGTALPLICYEAIFPQNITGASGRPDFLINITNDAWFGAFAGPQQHLAQARMRAVEQGLPMARAANTGVSAMIDAGGRVIASIPLNEAGFIDVPLPAPQKPTVYASTGDLPVFSVILLTLLGLGLSRLRNSH